MELAKLTKQVEESEYRNVVMAMRHVEGHRRFGGGRVGAWVSFQTVEGRLGGMVVSLLDDDLCKTTNKKATRTVVRPTDYGADNMEHNGEWICVYHVD